MIDEEKFDDEEEFEEEFSKLHDTDYNDGIYILANRRSWLSRHLEYRVAYLSDIDALYDEEWTGEILYTCFTHAKVFKNEEDAIAEAMVLLEKYPHTDNGVGVVYKWDNITYKKLIGG